MATNSTATDRIWKLHNFIFKYLWGWGMVILVIVLMVVSVLLTLWAYDGDVKCLVAECRRIKDRD